MAEDGCLRPALEKRKKDREGQLSSFVRPLSSDLVRPGLAARVGKIIGIGETVANGLLRRE
jgi:hypothetical protein